MAQAMFPRENQWEEIPSASADEILDFKIFIKQKKRRFRNTTNLLKRVEAKDMLKKNKV